MGNELDVIKDAQTLGEMERIINDIQQNGWEVGSPEFDAAISNLLDVKYPQKIDSYVFKGEACEFVAEYYKRIETRAAAARKTAEAVEKRLKERLKDHMLSQGLKSLEGNVFTLKLSPTKERIVIDENRIDKKWCDQVTTWEPNKERIAAARLEGQEIDGVSFEGGFALRKYMNRGVK